MSLNARSCAICCLRTVCKRYFTNILSFPDSLQGFTDGNEVTATRHCGCSLAFDNKLEYFSLN